MTPVLLIGSGSTTHEGSPAAAARTRCFRPVQGSAKGFCPSWEWAYLAQVRSCNRRHGFVGHRWQGRFKSPAVERQGYWLRCGRYIERNPLEAGMVRLPWEYAWSSCRAYALGQSDPLLSEDRCYAELSPDPRRRQELGREFLVREDVREVAIRGQAWAVGDDDFRVRMAEVLGRPAPRRRGRPRKAPATKG